MRDEREQDARTGDRAGDLVVRRALLDAARPPGSVAGVMTMRCSTCGISYPNTYTHRACRVCGEPTSLVRAEPDADWEQTVELFKGGGRKDADPLLDWRRSELVRAGYGDETAGLLATQLHVDLHLAAWLVARGCRPELAARILL